MIAEVTQEKDYYLPAQLLNYDNQLTPGVEGGKRTPNTGGAIPQKLVEAAPRRQQESYH